MFNLLYYLGACDEGIEWAQNQTLAQVWQNCPRADWLAWLVGRLPIHPINLFWKLAQDFTDIPMRSCCPPNLLFLLCRDRDQVDIVRNCIPFQKVQEAAHRFLIQWYFCFVSETMEDENQVFKEVTVLRFFKPFNLHSGFKIREIVVTPNGQCEVFGTDDISIGTFSVWALENIKDPFE